MGLKSTGGLLVWSRPRLHQRSLLHHQITVGFYRDSLESGTDDGGDLWCPNKSHNTDPNGTLLKGPKV